MRTVRPFRSTPHCLHVSRTGVATRPNLKPFLGMSSSRAWRDATTRACQRAVRRTETISTNRVRVLISFWFGPMGRFFASRAISVAKKRTCCLRVSLLRRKHGCKAGSDRQTRTWQGNNLKTHTNKTWKPVRSLKEYELEIVLCLLWRAWAWF